MANNVMHSINSIKLVSFRRSDPQSGARNQIRLGGKWHSALAKLARKIFLHRLIFNWIFFNGFNVYIKLIYIFIFAGACILAASLTLSHALSLSLFLSSALSHRREFFSIFIMLLLMPLPRIVDRLSHFSFALCSSLLVFPKAQHFFSLVFFLYSHRFMLHFAYNLFKRNSCE